MPELIKIKYQKQFKVPAVNASETYRIPIPNDAINTHNFFNDLTVINLSSNDLEFTPDNDTDRSFFVPAKSSFNWSFKNDNMKYSNLFLTELSGANLSADEVQVIVVKKRYEVV